MVWNQTYETGNAQVDSEHQEIFLLVQGLITATLDSSQVKGKVQEAMDFLAGYTVNHFKHEESLMEESQYPIMPVHKKQHDDFVVQVLALKERLLSESDSEKNSLDIQKVIVNWLTDHVLGSDKLMAGHYREWKEKSGQ